MLSVTNMNDDYYYSNIRIVTTDSESPESPKHNSKEKNSHPTPKNSSIFQEDEKAKRGKKGKEAKHTQKEKRNQPNLSRQSSSSEDSSDSDPPEIEEQNIFSYIWRLFYTLIITHIFFVVASYESNFLVRTFCSFGGCFYLFRVFPHQIPL